MSGWFAAARPTLIVLDNCEHLLTGAAAVAAAFAGGPPGTRVLATSRERLGTVREHPQLVRDGTPVELVYGTHRLAAVGPDGADGLFATDVHGSTITTPSTVDLVIVSAAGSTPSTASCASRPMSI